jgi:putative tryptophan/tyrosine transport system substrate-binding protein
VTGLTWDAGLEIGGKRLELLKEASPVLSRVTSLWDPNDTDLASYWPPVRRAAEALGLIVESVEVRSLGDLEKGLAQANERRSAVFIWAGPFLNEHIKTVCNFALKHRLVTLSPVKAHASEDGCLIGHAPNPEEL